MKIFTASTRRNGWAGRILTLCASAALDMMMAGSPATAQGQFVPVAKVNDSAVTVYERNQRMAFLRILNAPGDITQLALDQLINERLLAQYGKALDLPLRAPRLRDALVALDGPL